MSEMIKTAMRYLLSISLASLGVRALAQAPHVASHIFTCGRTSVVESELGPGLPGKQTLTPVWTWTAATSRGMPLELVVNFSTIDECKPATNGKEILVTSSHDGVAIVSRTDGSTLFSAKVKNAHSAALLSGTLFAVASSDAADGSGDQIVFFDRRVPGVILGTIPFEAAHGLVWDENRHTLWALGMHQLMELQVARESGELKIKVLSTRELPERVGHDLRMAPDCSALYLTTTHHVFRYNPQANTFTAFGELGNRVDVKSISFQPASGRLLYTVADPGGYWTSTLRLTEPRVEATLPSPIYKARWATDLPPHCSIR